MFLENPLLQIIKSSYINARMDASTSVKRQEISTIAYYSFLKSMIMSANKNDMVRCVILSIWNVTF